MTSVSNIAIGAHLAGNAAAKARHGMNDAIGRLSTGMRGLYGGDACGAAGAIQYRAEGKSAYVAARAQEDGISFLQASESALLEISALAVEMAVLNTRLRELAVQKSSGLLATNETAAITAEEDALDAAGDTIAAYKLNNKALLGTQHSYVKDLDGATTSLGSTATPAIEKTVSAIDTDIQGIQKDLGNVAAGINALKGMQAALYALSANAEAMASRLQDTDFAYSSAQLARFSVLNQSAMAMVAQANQANNALLAVLQ